MGLAAGGEVVAFSTPWYTEETISTSFHLLKDILIPLVKTESIIHPDQLQSIFKNVKRNYMAKASLEGAVWDLFAKKEKKSLAHALGGEKTEIESGVVVGISSIPRMQSK